MPESGGDTVRDLAIQLDSADGPRGSVLHRPGQMLTGRVRLRLLKPLSVRNLDLLVQGSGTVSWGRGGGHFVRDDEIYVNDMAELVDTGLGRVLTLSAGEHVFPFACCLPRHLPSTFSGSFGSVAYAAKAVMQAALPGAGGPWTAAAPFAIESELPPAAGGPDEQLELLRPCLVEARMQVGASLGRCVKATLSLPKRVFAAQEDLLVSATVANRSRKTIARLTAGLVMDCLYQAAGGQQQFRESLLVADRVDEYRIGHKEGRCWKNARLRIPRLIPPSGLPHCRLISVSYSLLFRAEVENCAKDLNLRVPIVVGAAHTEPAAGAASEPNGGDFSTADVAEPEVMQRMSRVPSVSLDSASVEGTWGCENPLGGGQRQRQQQRPVGSTEKLPSSSDYYIFDPATQQVTGPSADASAGGGDGRYLPPDFYAPNTDRGEDLY